jgi:hypothetical protein
MNNNKNMNKLYFYLLNSEEHSIFISEREIMRETRFSYRTRSSAYRKRDMGRVQPIDKGERTDYLYISTCEIADPWSIFRNRSTADLS